MVVDLDRLSVYEILTDGADLLRRGSLASESMAAGNPEFLAAAVIEGWIHSDGDGGTE